MGAGWDVERTLRRLELSYIEPLQFAARKRRRLALFGIGDLAEVPGASVDWMPSTPECTPDCPEFIAGELPYFAKYVFENAPQGAVRRGVPCVVDLDRHADFASYVGSLRGHSKRENLRQIRRARRAGFTCRRIFRPLYLRQRFNIDVSKRFRSGLVLATLFRRRPAAEFDDGITAADIAARFGRSPADIAAGMPLPEPPPPPCPHHWRDDWGVFIGEGADPTNGAAGGRPAAPGERLVGYVFLRRTGTVVRTTAVMGHAAYLDRAIMKLLFHDVMAWLLARRDRHVQGVRFFQYGALEHGSPGLIAWKQRFGFVPMRYRLPPALPGP